MRKILMCDPPSGWRYGFPKEVPHIWRDEKDLRPWLLSVGYPPLLIKNLGEHFRVRLWEKEVDD